MKCFYRVSTTAAVMQHVFLSWFCCSTEHTLLGAVKRGSDDPLSTAMMHENTPVHNSFESSKTKFYVIGSQGRKKSTDQVHSMVCDPRPQPNAHGDCISLFVSTLTHARTHARTHAHTQRYIVVVFSLVYRRPYCLFLNYCCSTHPIMLCMSSLNYMCLAILLCRIHSGSVVGCMKYCHRLATLTCLKDMFL